MVPLKYFCLLIALLSFDRLKNIGMQFHVFIVLYTHILAIKSRLIIIICSRKSSWTLSAEVNWSKPFRCFRWWSNVNLLKILNIFFTAGGPKQVLLITPKGVPQMTSHSSLGLLAAPCTWRRVITRTIHILFLIDYKWTSSNICQISSNMYAQDMSQLSRKAVHVYGSWTN